MNDTLFINLKVIAKLKPKQRLSTLEDILRVEEDSTIPYLWLTRRYYGNSRKKTLIRINLLLTQCRQYCVFNSADAVLLKRMHKHLNSAIDGIKNLKKTYQGDVTVISQLDNTIDRINSILLSLAVNDTASDNESDTE